MNRDTEIGKLLGFHRVAHTHHYLVPHGYKLAYHVTAYKTGGSSDEIFHDAFSCCGNVLFADRFKLCSRAAKACENSAANCTSNMDD